VHELLGEVISPSAMADRVKTEADAREAVYKAALAEWQDVCNRIENENEAIRENNKQRDELITDATKQFEAEMSTYEHQIREYNDTLEARLLSHFHLLL
jgi:peptidoglycan hydrolase CwlO-like protein